MNEHIRKFSTVLLVVVALSLFLAGCATTRRAGEPSPAISKVGVVVGTATGVAAGVFTGNRWLGVAAGFVGYAVGSLFENMFDAIARERGVTDCRFHEELVNGVALYKQVCDGDIRIPVYRGKLPNVPDPPVVTYTPEQVKIQVYPSENVMQVPPARFSMPPPPPPPPPAMR